MLTVFILFFIYTIFKEDTQLASKASLPCGPLEHTNIKYIQIYTVKWHSIVTQKDTNMQIDLQTIKLKVYDKCLEQN